MSIKTRAEKFCRANNVDLGWATTLVKALEVERKIAFTEAQNVLHDAAKQWDNLGVQLHGDARDRSASKAEAARDLAGTLELLK